jgi:hypothetical protein
MTTSQQDGTMIDKHAQFDLAKEIADSEQKKPWPSGTTPRRSSRSTTSASSSSPWKRVPG